MSKRSNGTMGDKVALVTGASSGIGEATASALAKAGYKVFGTGRSVAAGDSIDGVRMIRCDVTSGESVNRAVSEVETAAGRIDVLINNAGVGLLGAAEESSIEQVQSVFDTNVYGTMRMTQAVLPIMRRQKSGRIINLSSILGLIPSPFSAHYGAAKHAVEGYSESLDHEVRRFGIRVVLVEPGMTRSTFERNAATADSPIPDYADDRAKALRWLSDGMKVADTPASVARTIVIAARAEKPRLRYTSGTGVARIALLRRFVPGSAFDKSLRQQMGLS